VPPGVGDPNGCTPYIFAYRASDLGPRTRDEADDDEAPAYSLARPGEGGSTALGGDGVHANVAVTTHNWGFASAGPLDEDGFALPVSLAITASSTNGVRNEPDALAGLNYENPMVGDGLDGDRDGDACTNAPPPAWMEIELTARVTGLMAGNYYNLYEYTFDNVVSPGPGQDSSVSALAVPTGKFNANAGMATNAINFVATGPTYTHAVKRSSNQVVVFRCVPVLAP